MSGTLFQFVPNVQFINSISLGQTTIVGFTATHNFSVGENVSFRVTKPYGTVEINNLKGLVLATTSNSITVNIDSTNFTPFVYPVTGANSPPTCVPSSSGIIPGSNPATVNIFDAFDNERLI